MFLKSKILILVVDDHEELREVLIANLQQYSDFEVVGEAEDGEMAIAFCWRQQPDVILMDMLMPRIDGNLATTLIHAQFPNIQIIMLSCFSDHVFVRDALQAGVSSYLVKNSSIDQVSKTIRQLCIPV